MAEYKSVIDEIVSSAAGVSDVPVYHAPSTSAGEKIIYRCTPGKYDGEFEVFTVTMRFISRDLATAFQRAEKVAGIICRRGERGVRFRDTKVYGIREEGGSSGFIGRTGHFYVLTRFEVKYRRSSAERYAIVRPVEG